MINLTPNLALLFIASAKQCLFNILLIIMTIPYVICVGNSKMKNDACDGNYT